MKILISAVLATSGIGVTTAVNNRPVQAVKTADLYNGKYLRKRWFKAVVTRNVKMAELKSAKYGYQIRAVRYKILKKGTHIKITEGGMREPIVVRSKGLAYRGYQLKSGEQNNGYFWTVGAGFKNWFKLSK